MIRLNNKHNLINLLQNIFLKGIYYILMSLYQHNNQDYILYMMKHLLMNNILLDNMYKYLIQMKNMILPNIFYIEMLLYLNMFQLDI